MYSREYTTEDLIDALKRSDEDSRRVAKMRTILADAKIVNSQTREFSLFHNGSSYID